MIYCQYRATC